MAQSKLKVTVISLVFLALKIDLFLKFNFILYLCTLFLCVSSKTVSSIYIMCGCGKFLPDPAYPPSLSRLLNPD